MQDDSPLMQPQGPVYGPLYDKWFRSIIYVYFAGWFLVTMLEVCMGFVMGLMSWTYILRRVLMPALLDGTAITINMFVFNSHRLSDKQKNYCAVTVLWFICMVLSTVHCYFPVRYGLLIGPVVASVAFLDGNLCIFSLVLSISGVVLTYFIPMALKETLDYTMQAECAAIAAVIILVFALVISLVLRLFMERENILLRLTKENRILAASVRRDGLTGLLNHTAFYTCLKEQTELLSKTGQTYAVAMIDIDNFKQVNDNWGHASGDEILVAVADLLVRCTNKNGVCFRYGGDEFSIVFKTDDENIVTGTLQSVLQAARQDATLLDAGGVTLSAGYYLANDAEQTEKQSFYLADEALYRAKFSGKDCVVSAGDIKPGETPLSVAPEWDHRDSALSPDTCP